jgi:hypothetical protein
LLHPHVSVLLSVILTYITLQACGIQHEDVTVPTKPDIDSKTKAILLEEDTEAELLKEEEDTEVAALKDQLEVRNISVYCHVFG